MSSTNSILSSRRVKSDAEYRPIDYELPELMPDELADDMPIQVQSCRLEMLSEPFRGV